MTSIRDYAFYWCSGLTSITIPSSVTSIGDEAFSWCVGLPSITIPNSVTSIGDWAFVGCSGLTSVTIPNSVTSIGRYAFEGTAWYNNQPNGLVYAGNVAYKYKGTMPKNTNMVLEEGTKTIGYAAFSGCSGLTSVTIPSSVTSIDYGAFQKCSSLTSITLGKNVTSIGDYAFQGCSGLKEVYVETPMPPTVESNSFDSYRTTSKVLYAPTASVYDYKNSKWYDFFSNILGYTPAPSEVNAVSNDDSKEAARYTLDGKRSSSVQKGVNIIKMNDGTTKKVMVR